LVFPCGADTHARGRKQKSLTGLAHFQKVMLGLRVEKVPFKKEAFEVRNKTFQVLKSVNCFTTPEGAPYIDEIDRHTMTPTELRKAEAQQAKEMKNHLQEEYRSFVGSLDPTTTRKFHELVASAIVRRLQLSCGLSTRMKRSVDGDEIICVVRADEEDLRTEAERVGYRLQLYNQPFSKTAQAGTTVSAKQASACRQLLRDRVGCGDKTEPLLDPAFFRDMWHRKLLRFLEQHGHNEDTCNKRDGVYIAPYAEFKHDPRFQPLFRRWTTVGHGGEKHVSIFRAVDRIRLVNSIIARNINLEALQFAKLLVQNGFYALHDMNELEWFRSSWALNARLKKQPLRQIRNYFGEKVALYFAWLEFYTRSLRIPALLGMVTFAAEVTGHNYKPAVVLYAIFVCFWATGFAELWNRKNAFLNLWWGTTGFKDAERERPQFYGQMRYNPVNDAKEMYYPSVKALRMRMFQAAAVVFITISVAVLATVACLGFKAYLVQREVQFGRQIAGMANGVQIGILNSVYRIVATKLTVYENHRTDSQHENNLIIKTFLFRFFNSYASFFYIAFLKKPLETAGCDMNNDCMAELRMQLGSIFISQLVAGNAAELLVPYIKSRMRMRADAQNLAKDADADADAIEFETPELEAKYEPYGDREAFDDNAEMVVQFGYVTLFVVAFPLAPLLAWGSNVVEQHIDAYKLCFDHKRPNPKQADSIGMWQYFLSLISRISVITNIALVFFTANLFDEYTSATRWLLFMLAEHVLLFAKGILEDAVPDTPLQIEQLSARHEYTVKKVFHGLQAESDEAPNLAQAESLELTIHGNGERLVDGEHSSDSRVVVNVLHSGKVSRRAGGKGKGKAAVAKQAEVPSRPVSL
jgi:hypothetical protein